MGRPAGTGPSARSSVNQGFKVQVRCGGESKLLKVDEPEVCKYVADFETPGACTAEDARLAQQEVESCAADIEE